MKIKWSICMCMGELFSVIQSYDVSNVLGMKHMQASNYAVCRYKDC